MGSLVECWWITVPPGPGPARDRAGRRRCSDP